MTGITFIIVVLSCIASTISQDVCPSKDKIDCGYIGIDQKICEDKGCCWKESEIDGEPWCFYQVNSQPTCEREATDDCGFFGITEEECVNKGCCYKETKEDKVPWCYYQQEVATADECREDWPNRIDCGYYGITEEECLDNGCCWSTIKEGVPWCYKKYIVFP